MLYRTVTFSMTLNDPYPDFKASHYLMLNFSETIRDRDVVTMRGIIIWTYAFPTQACHLFRMILSER